MVLPLVQTPFSQLHTSKPLSRRLSTTIPNGVVVSHSQLPSQMAVRMAVTNVSGSLTTPQTTSGYPSSQPLPQRSSQNSSPAQLPANPLKRPGTVLNYPQTNSSLQPNSPSRALPMPQT